jgi:hypothetical protein
MTSPEARPRRKPKAGVTRRITEPSPKFLLRPIYFVTIYTTGFTSAPSTGSDKGRGQTLGRTQLKPFDCPRGVTDNASASGAGNSGSIPDGGTTKTDNYRTKLQPS